MRDGSAESDRWAVIWDLMRRRVFTAAAAVSLSCSLSLPASWPRRIPRRRAAASGAGRACRAGAAWRRARSGQVVGAKLAVLRPGAGEDCSSTSRWPSRSRTRAAIRPARRPRRTWTSCVRKRRLTNRATVDLRDSDMTYGASGGSSDYSMATLRNHVEYDLSKRTVVVTGVELYHNSLYFMDSRITGYVGAGMTVLETPHAQAQSDRRHRLLGVLVRRRDDAADQPGHRRAAADVHAEYGRRAADAGVALAGVEAPVDPAERGDHGIRQPGPRSVDGLQHLGRHPGQQTRLDRPALHGARRRQHLHRSPAGARPSTGTSASAFASRSSCRSGSTGRAR